MINTKEIMLLSGKELTNYIINSAPIYEINALKPNVIKMLVNKVVTYLMDFYTNEKVYKYKIKTYKEQVFILKELLRYNIRYKDIILLIDILLNIINRYYNYNKEYKFTSIILYYIINNNLTIEKLKENLEYIIDKIIKIVNISNRLTGLIDLKKIKRKIMKSKTKEEIIKNIIGYLNIKIIIDKLPNIPNITEINGYITGKNNFQAFNINFTIHTNLNITLDLMKDNSIEDINTAINNIKISYNYATEKIEKLIKNQKNIFKINNNKIDIYIKDNKIRDEDIKEMYDESFIKNLIIMELNKIKAERLYEKEIKNLKYNNMVDFINKLIDKGYEVRIVYKGQYSYISQYIKIYRKDETKTINYILDDIPYNINKIIVICIHDKNGVDYNKDAFLKKCPTIFIKLDKLPEDS